MKKMRRMFVALVVLMGVLTGVALNSRSALATMAEDGFAVPADSGLSRLLSSSDGPAVTLVDVDYDDVVYSSLNGYFVGRNRASIDRSFPIYINSGAGLRFLDEETWLVSSEVDLLRTYEGLYLTDGYTYNSDLSQADAEEFILLALQNKLFMNAQAAVFENRITSHNIPSNSILSMTDSSIRWYYLDANALVYASEESVFDATLTIGSHTYDYADLLRALELVQEAIDRAENQRPTDDLTQEIDEILNGEAANRRDPTQGEVRPGETEAAVPGTAASSGGDSSGPDEGQDPEAGAPEDGPSSDDPEDGSDLPDGADPTSRPTGGDRVPGSSGSSSSHSGHSGHDKDSGDDGDGGDSEDGDKETPSEEDGDDDGGSKGNDPSENGGNSTGSSGSGSGSTTDTSSGDGGDSSSSPADGDSSASGGTTGEGQGSGSGSGTGGSAGDGELPDGDENDQPGGEKGDGSGNSGADNPNPNPGENPNPAPEKPQPLEPMKYEDPVVELKNMEAWTYALGGELKINDPYGAIQRGVKIGVYGRLSGDKVEVTDETVTDAAGNPVKVYSKDGAEGKSTIVRRTFVGDQTVALAPIPPEKTFYVQLYYRYTEETDRKQNEDGTYTLTYARHTYYSNFYELTTEQIESFVQPIRSDWTTVFAAQDTAIELDNFTIANTSDYDPAMTGDDLTFDNFKKDTLPYIYRMEYTLTPLKDDGSRAGDDFVLSAGSSVMNKAKQAGGTVFHSTTPKLDSNCRYKVSVRAKDRYGNFLPLEVTGPDGALVNSADWEGIVFTRKTAPKVTIEEVENVTDRLTVRVTVSDPDHALAAEDGKALPLKFSAANAQGEAAAIYGQWAEGGSGAFGSETTHILELPDPKDGKTYTLVLESLAFAQLYALQVTGDYDPQPIVAGAAEAGNLGRLKDQVLGSTRSYTASLTAGSVSFSSGVENLLDTCGTLQMTMNERSTMEILPLVDEFRFFLTEKESGKQVKSFTLKMTDLDVSDQYPFDPKTSSVILRDGGSTEPTIRLTGSEAAYAQVGNNPWKALLIRQVYNENLGENVYIKPMTLCVDLPVGTMKTSTRHVMRMESVVIKSGVEYQIPTSLSVTEFTTRKIQPKFYYDDLFIAGDVVEYLGLWIDDPDGTICESDGLVTAYLYLIQGDKETRLQASELHANKDPQSLRFEGLIPGANYSLRFIAKCFNDAEGFTNQKFDYELTRFNFTGGSFLTGSLNLAGLDYHTRTGVTNSEPFYHISGEELLSEIERSKNEKVTQNNEGNVKAYDYWVERDSDLYMSPMLEIGSKITFLQLDGYHPDKKTGTMYVYFRFYSEKNNNKPVSETKWDIGWAWRNISGGATPVVAVPENAKYVRIKIQDREYAGRNGITLLSYSQPKGENYFETYHKYGAEIISGVYTNGSGGLFAENKNGWNVLDKLPVKPGEVYVFMGNSNEGHFNLYSKDKGYLGQIAQPFHMLFRVPQDVYYISVSFNLDPAKNPRYLYRLSDVTEEDGFDAKVEVTVEDTKGYLYAIGTPHVQLDLYKSDSIQLPSYPDKPVAELSQRVELEPKDEEVRKNPDQWSTYKGSWIPKGSDANGVLALLKERLTPNSKWRLTLSADYKGSLVVLDTIEFQTDGAYDTISNNAEMRKILRNPYGNFLVVSDFEHNLNIDGLNLYGSLDFQGHIITRGEGITYSSNNGLIQTNYGVIRNLIYDYPETDWYANKRTILYNNATNGVLENVIVRTHGTLEINNVYCPLLCMYNSGTIRNFIVQLGGDLRIHANQYNMGGVFYQNTGVIEDGYIYASTGHGVLMYNNSDWSGTFRYGAVVWANMNQAFLRNVYTIFDTWYSNAPSPTNNMSFVYAGWDGSKGKVENCYHVGEFYNYTGWLNSEEKSYASRYNRPAQVTFPYNQETTWNLSYFTDYAYASHYNSPRYVYQQPIKGLRDTQWQAETLGASFDAEGCVPMGFYPRLKTLPTELQKYQEYIPLPTRSEGVVPVPTTDGWADPKLYGEPTNEEGVIRVVFQNDRGATIKSLSATTNSGEDDTLELTIISQGFTKDGLWEVFLNAKATDYLSSYTITHMTYSLGGATLDADLNYRTQNIAFWKEVSDTEQWNAINTHMNWNYRVVDNIDFKDVKTPAFMTIDGNLNGFGGIGFSGKIDGQGHTLKNISLPNINRPWLFHTLSNAGELRNLIFENLHISAATNTPKDNARTGLIRVTAHGSLVENVHIRGGVYEGLGWIGGISAQHSGRMIACSVADTTITDIGSSAAVYAGGLTGYADSYSSISSSYVRQLDMTVRTSKTVSGGDGSLGGSGSCSVDNCYATGSISAKAQSLGGIVGRAENGTYSTVRRSWSDVDLDSYHATGHVGGAMGYSNGVANTNVLVMGDIISMSFDTTHRLVGEANSAANLSNHTAYGYIGQVISGVDKDDAYQVRRLFDEASLACRGVWTETIKLGSGWDYDPVTQETPAFPKLLRPSTGEVLWGQEDIPLPVPNPYELRVSDNNEVADSGKTMVAHFEILHRNLDFTDKTQDELKELFKVSIKGMDMSDAAFKDGRASIVITPEPGRTSFTVTTKTRTMALDYYRLTVDTPSGAQLSGQVYYGQPFYWDVPDIDTWNKLMDPNTDAGGHGYTNENFRITGMVNFSSAEGVAGTTQYLGLRLGRLEGPTGYAWKEGPDEQGDNKISVDDKELAVGFRNLSYTAGTECEPWIECVDHPIERLYFSNITAHFNQTAVSRERSGPILMCGGLHDLVFDNISLETAYNSNFYFGFISQCSGTMERVRVNGLKMARAGTSTSESSYAGGVVARVTQSAKEVEAENIEVNMPYTNYLGGVVGSLGGNSDKDLYTHILSGTFKDITIIGRCYAGGFAGTTGIMNIDGVTLENINVTVKLYWGGAFAGSTSPRNFMQDILVKNCDIKDTWVSSYVNSSTTTLGVGGFAGNLGSRAEPIRRIRVEDTNVTSNYLAGGIAANLQCTIRDAEIAGCKITSRDQGTDPKKHNFTMCTGGVCGYYSQSAPTVYLTGVVVRGCEITGRSDVGGLVGRGTGGSRLQIQNCFVAEDMTITATGTQSDSNYSNAGGLVGQAVGFDISNCASGAKVYGPGQAVGGLIGLANYTDASAGMPRTLKNCISAGEEVRADDGNAGGIIGLFNSATAKLKDDALSNIVVATNVVGGDNKSSLWINDGSTINLTNHDFDSVLIWDHSTINGQLACDVAAAAEASGSDPHPAKPRSSELVTAAELRTRSFYTSHDFTPASEKTDFNDFFALRGNWDLRYLATDENQDTNTNRFFPYPAFNNWQSSSNIPSETSLDGQGARRSNQVLELARWSDASFANADWVATGDTVVGIPLPDETVSTKAETVVYASGINTVNVETNPSNTVKLNGTPLTLDSNGVATIRYDFKSDLTLDLNGTTTTYKAEDLRRDTLVAYDYWYFIDLWGTTSPKETLHYGAYTSNILETSHEAESVNEAGSLLTGVVHLWGNQALTADGTIHDLIANYAQKAEDQTGSDLTEAQPFLQYTHGTQKATVKVFHNFTLYGNSKIEQRLYQLEGDGRLYSISPYQGYVYDGVFLIRSGAGESQHNYFAVRDKEGGLTSYLSAIHCTNWQSDHIKQMSNTFWAACPLAVLRYDTGRVCVVDFSSDQVVYDSQPATTSLLSYAGSYLNSLFATPGQTATVFQDPTYKDALDKVWNYRDPAAELSPGPGGDSDVENSGDSTLSGDGQGGGEGMGGDALPAEAGSGEGTPETGGLPVSGEDSGSGTNDPSDQTEEPGLSGGDGELALDGQEVEDGTNELNGPGGPEGPGGVLSGDEAGSEDASQGGPLSGNAAGSEDASQGGPLPGDETGSGDASQGGPLPGNAAGSGDASQGGDALSGGELPENTGGTQASGNGGNAGEGPLPAEDGKELPEAVFVQPEEGKIFEVNPSGGLSPVSYRSMSYDEKSGTYSLDETTYYLDHTASLPKTLPGAVALVSEEVHTRQLMEELGAAMVAYDPITGQYDAYVTQSLLSDAPRKTSDPVPGTVTEPLAADDPASQENTDSTFTVGHGLGRDLTTREQRGFTLLAVAAAAALGILGVIFAREKRRKR